MFAHGTKPYHHITSTFLVLLMVVALPSCRNARVEGRVMDALGSNLEGVTIRIENSAHTAETNSGGMFSIPFTPGQFTLVLEKDGFLSQSFDLSVMAKERYPLADVALFLRPPGNEVYHVRRDGYFPIPKQKLARHSRLTGRSMQGLTQHYETHLAPSDHWELPELSEGMHLFVVGSEMVEYKGKKEFRLFKLDYKELEYKENLGVWVVSEVKWATNGSRNVDRANQMAVESSTLPGDFVVLKIPVAMNEVYCLVEEEQVKDFMANIAFREPAEYAFCFRGEMEMQAGYGEELEEEYNE